MNGCAYRNKERYANFTIEELVDLLSDGRVIKYSISDKGIDIVLYKPEDARATIRKLLISLSEGKR